MENSIISKIFPSLNDDLKTKLKYDTEGLWSITLPEDAEDISKIVKNELGEDKVILDGTSGLGGNVISFSRYFKKVIAVEQNKERFELLKNNVEIYGLKNVELVNDNCINYITNEYDGYFFDPPWGGPDYKNNKLIKIKLGNYSLKDIINMIKEKNKKTIFIKLPENYDFDEFKNFNYKINKIKNYFLLTFY